MPVLTIELVLQPWLAARLGGAVPVMPGAAAPPAAGPYVTYTRYWADNWATLGGPTRVHRAKFQLDVWGQDHAACHQLAATIQGSVAAPGLNGFKGDMTAADGQTTVVVLQCWLTEPGLADGWEDPRDASERGWFRVRGDYDLTWNEGP